MPYIGRNLKALFKANGHDATVAHFSEALSTGKIKPGDVSIRELAQGLCGDDWAGVLSRSNGGVARFTEAGSSEAVDASEFADISGQLLVNEIKQKYNSPDFIGDKLVETVPITNGNLGTQKTPWQSDVIDTGNVVQPGMPYPHTKFTQQWIIYPAPEKYGQICAVTMEAIFADLTGQILESAGSVGRACGYQKEVNILKVVLGVTNNFTYSGPGPTFSETAYNTYQTAGTYWTNSVSDLLLTDWNDVNQLEQLFYQMTDPVTGRMIAVKPNRFLVMPYNKYTAKRILHATEVRSGDITTGTGDQTVSANPLDVGTEILTSAIARKALVDSGVTASKADNYWYMFDSTRAFVWRQVYGLKTENAQRGNPMEFNQDIAVAVKAGWFGIAAVRDPRYAGQGFDA